MVIYIYIYTLVKASGWYYFAKLKFAFVFFRSLFEFVLSTVIRFDMTKSFVCELNCSVEYRHVAVSINLFTRFFFSRRGK